MRQSVPPVDSCREAAPSLRVFDTEAPPAARPTTKLSKTVGGVRLTVREWTDTSYRHCKLCPACDIQHGPDARAWCMTDRDG